MAAFDRERWRVLEPLLDQALELSAAEQATWLERLRSSAPDLAVELSEILSGEVAADADRFLNGAIQPTLAGQLLGAYTLERPLGQGGMGSVWLARRHDGRFEGSVAVKFLSVALLSSTGQERFRREGSMLARLAHPGIARLFDAGVSPGGQPYLVLEYVDGQPIDTFARASALSRDGRIRLVLQVLSAVAHAHANLIVHRDLKPSNIFVTASGSVKLLDFGIAKLLDAQGSEHTLTGDGGRAFSAAYAAPEQIRGTAITTGTDVYALGVLLYTLLTGRHPFEFAGRSAADVERMICQDYPPRPSAAVVPGGDDPRDRSHLEPRALRGDLDAIIMKALRKEPERRYPSAAALAEDLKRHLVRRPVLARPDDTWYRVRKFVARNRTGVSVAATLALLLVGFALRERTLRARSDAQARRAAAVEQYLVSVFDVADPLAHPNQHPEDVTARTLLDRGAARIDSALVGQPDVQAEMQWVLGEVYEKLGLIDQSGPMLQRVLDHRRALYGKRHPQVAAIEMRLGNILTRQNRFAEAEPLLRDALAQRRAFLGNADTATAAAISEVAYWEMQRSRYAPAESLYRESLAIYRAALGRAHLDVADAQQRLGTLLVVRGVNAEAEPLLRESLWLRRERYGIDDINCANAELSLAQSLQQLGRYAEADTLYRHTLAVTRRVLGNDHPAVSLRLNNLANMLARQMGRPDEAEPLVREALDIDRRVYGERHNIIAGGLDNLGAVLRAKGDLDGAELAFRQSMEMGRDINGAEHRIPARAFANLAGVRHIRGDTAGVMPMLREARAQMAHILGEHASSVTTATIYLAQHVRERGRADEADSIFRGLASWLDSTKTPERTQFYTARLGLGQSLTDRGRASEGQPLLEAALAARLAEFGAQDWRTGEARMALGDAFLQLGQRSRAEPLLRDAYTVLDGKRRVQPRLARQAGAVLRRAGLTPLSVIPSEARNPRSPRRGVGPGQSLYRDPEDSSLRSE